MSKFKDYINNDLDIFLNQNEFAEIHKVNGFDMPIIWDKDLLKERQAKIFQETGLYQIDVLFHVKKENIGYKPVVGEMMVIDNDTYRVSDIQEDQGIYTIELVANES
jgi:hypothetical protein